MTVAVKGAALLLAMSLLFGLAACGGPASAVKPQNAAAPERVQWVRQPGGLTLNLTADKALNPFEGFTHNLMLCIYQMSEPDLFKELAASTGGIQKLLTCEPFDPSMVAVQRYFVRPEEVSSLVLDREAGVRFVGLVAGYNDPQPGQSTILHAFPVNSHRRGWWPWSRGYEPGSLNLTILLKSNSIQSTGVE